MSQTSPQPLPDPIPCEDELQVYRWLKGAGLGNVDRLSAECLLPLLPKPISPRLAALLGRRPLIDFANERGLERNQELLTGGWPLLVLAASHAFLRIERDRVAAARLDVSARVCEPAELRAKPFHTALARLRTRFDPAVPPESRELLASGKLEIDPLLPGFRWTDARRWLPEREVSSKLIRPSVALALRKDVATASCSCGRKLCRHALAAIDAVLLWLKDALDSARLTGLGQLNRPDWQRALDAFDGALAARPAEAQQRGWVTWRLKVHGPELVVVSGFLHRPSQKGPASLGRQIAGPQLAELGALLPPEDLAIARLAGRSSHRLLKALIGHPRIFLEDDPTAAVRVERAKVGLVAEEREGTVVLTAGVDGAALRPAQCERARQVDSDQPFFLWDSGPRLLTVLEVADDVRALLDVLALHGNEFPPESHAELLERLTVAAARVPVAMPRSVMGEAVVPRCDPVLRVHLGEKRSVTLEVRVRAIAEAASCPPGSGTRDLYVRRGAKALHIRRDFEAEDAAATAWVRALGLGPESDDGAFHFFFPDPQGVLALLAAHPELEARNQLEWVDGRLRLLGSAGPGALRVVLEKKRDWFGALGGLTIAGERVALAVLLDAIRRDERFIEVRPGTFTEISEVLRRHLARIADHSHVAAQAVALSPSAAASLWELSRSGAALSGDDHWRTLASRAIEAQKLKPRVPRGLNAKLRDYQREGFEWMSRLAASGAGGVLADDMGLGKTVQALALLVARSKLGPALVLAPTSVGFNWLDEAARFAPKLKLHSYADVPDRAALLERLGPADVLVLSYGLLGKDLERLKSVKFATVVFDEAQALKNAATQRARAACDLQGDFKLALTGTPVENHLGELWSLYRILFPALFGSWEVFRSRFALRIEKVGDPEATAALGRVLQPFMLRRTKGEVEKELPPRTEIQVPVVLSADEWQLYEDARLATLSELGTSREKLKEQQRRLQVLASLTRLRLLASHPRLYDAASTVESSKLRRALELITELEAEGHRALVFSQFTSHLALVREVLDARGIPYVYLDGTTPRLERKERVREFQEGTAPVFLISLKAGGFGLNLTGADNVIHLDPWWNPAVEDQATDRAHRIGQRRPVTVYRLISRGTIEEQLLSLHDSKRALVSKVLEGKGAPGKITTEELLGLLSAERGNPSPAE